MGEIPYFQFENKYGETVTITVEDCVKKAEALLIGAGVKAEFLSEKFATEVIFSRAMSQPEYQNFFYKKIEELKTLLPDAKSSEINVLTPILINTVLLKYKAHLLFIEDLQSTTINTDTLAEIYLEKDANFSAEDEDEPFESEKFQEEEQSEIGESFQLWSIQRPKRIQGYALPLIRALEHFNEIGLRTRPTARDVLEYFRERVRSEPEAWPEIAQVHVHELAFYDSRGDVATADLEALRKAIGRFTSS
ncbi:hypothetical protein ATN89_23910 [Comamonas thiooxydans]|uniref:hypothetical protein n=1 Tax=Comamonas thiooxydans TaxID=363952 RepID=UPI0007C48F5D|nr:hypothetical protein [Comamonas thiooxydans]OAD81618.1 hypothetical protein ATN89_23910 [Comamonas thiooxydans]